jgi:hypothetical protein
MHPVSLISPEETITYNFFSEMQNKKSNFPLTLLVRVLPTRYPTSSGSRIYHTIIMNRTRTSIGRVTGHLAFAACHRPLACCMTRRRSRSFFQPTWHSYAERILETLSWTGRNKVPSNLAQRRGLCIIPKLGYDDRQQQHKALASDR